MQAVEILRAGTPVAPNVRFTRDRAVPEPGPGAVRIRTEASALNHLDLWVGRGLPGVEVAWPTVGGSDGAGIVDSVGPGVDSSWLGERVLLNAAIFQPHRPHPERAPAGEDIHVIGEHSPGTHAEFFIAPAENILAIGETDPVEAAAFALTHLTAWRMLVTRARLRAGMTVLIPGIGGGVALAALGIARHFGCTTIVTSRQQSKLDRARALGATHAVLDDGSDWSKQVRAITGGRGVDIVAESVGKAVHLACIKSMARAGVLVTCGCTTGPAATTDLARIFWNQLTIVGSTMGSMDEFREAVALLRSGALRPVIDQVVTPDAAPAAYARLEASEQFGKIVLRW